VLSERKTNEQVTGGPVVEGGVGAVPASSVFISEFAHLQYFACVCIGAVTILRCPKAFSSQWSTFNGVLSQRSHCYK